MRDEKDIHVFVIIKDKNVKARSYHAVATAIHFIAATGLHGIQCMCSLNVVMTMKSKPMQSQLRIQDFPDVGVPTEVGVTNLLFGQLFPKTT